MNQSGVAVGNLLGPSTNQTLPYGIGSGSRPIERHRREYAWDLDQSSAAVGTGHGGPRRPAG
eukprot:1181242-Prorocentrum_minimum.AAC.1